MIAAALVLALGGGLDATAVHEKRGAAYELAIAGTAKGLPDGAIVRLRFRRMIRGVSADGRMVVRAADEPSTVRRAVVEKGAFAHRESFASPGEVQLEILLDPADQELERKTWPVASVTKVFRLAPGHEVAAALRKEIRTMETALSARREADGATLLSATSRSWAAILAASRHDPAGGKLHGGAAAPLGKARADGAPMGDLLMREAAIVLVSEALAAPSDRRSLQALRRASSDLCAGPRGAVFAALAGPLDDLLLRFEHSPSPEIEASLRDLLARLESPSGAPDPRR